MDFKKEGFMKNLKSHLKGAQIMLGAVVIATVSLVVSGNLASQSAVKQMSLSSGIGTCFQRVSQTFTALMIKDLSSSYLQKDFMATTSDCFNYASKQFGSVYGSSFVDGKRSLAAINSDIHWFHEKATKLLKLSSGSDLDLSSSNIINKYSSLESLKESVQGKIASRVESKKSTSTMMFGASMAGVIVAFLMVGLSFYNRFKNKSLFRKIEEESDRIMASNSEFLSANIERALDNILSRIEMPKTYALFNRYHSDLLEKAYREFESNDGVDVDSTTPIHSEPVEDYRASTDYQNAMTLAIDGLSQKAFSRGIMLETALEDDFFVRGESEIVEQALCNLLNYAASRESVEAIGLKTKALGETAYLKIKMKNYYFSAEELNFINSGDSSESEVDLNLQLVSEMLKDLSASIKLTNKMNLDSDKIESEIEVLFEVVKNQKVVSKVVKGSKKDILRSLNAGL